MSAAVTTNTVSPTAPRGARLRSLLLTGGSALAILAVTPVAAQVPTTRTWSGAVNGAWTNQENWNGHIVPGSNDTAQINDTSQNIPVISSSVTIATLLTGSGTELKLLSAPLTLSNGTVSGLLTGFGEIVKNGTGDLVLSNANTIKASFTINGGSLVLRHNSAAGVDGATLSNIKLNGGAISYGWDNIDTPSIANAITLQGTSNRFTLDGGSIPSFVIQSGVISGAAGKVLLVDMSSNGSDAVLRLTGANTFSGGIELRSGTLNILSDNALGKNLAANSVTFNGGKLRIGDGSTPADVNAGLRPFIVNDVVGQNTLSITNGAKLTVGSLSGTGDLFLDDNGLLLLPNANAGMTGQLIVAGGGVAAGNSASFGTQTVRTIGSAIKFYASANDVVIANDIVIDGKGYGSIVLAATNFTQGNYALAGDISEGQGNKAQVLTGNIYQTAQSPNIVNLTGNNSFSGGVEHYQGILGIGSNTALGTGDLKVEKFTTVRALKDIKILNDVKLGSYGYAGGVGDNPVFDTQGFTFIISGVIDEFDPFATGRLTTSALNPCVTRLKNPSISAAPNCEPPAIGITKTGSGTLILSGSNLYNGVTLIKQGKLIMNGDNFLSEIIVADGAVLGGSGMTGDVTVRSGGSVAPGNSPGTLNVGSLVLASGSTLDMELTEPNVPGGPNNDYIIADDNVEIGSVLLNVTSPAGFGPGFGAGEYRLIDYEGTLTQTGTGLVIGSLPPGFSGVIDTSTDGEINLVATANGFQTQYWDGSNLASNNAVDGGTSTWDLSRTNWTKSDGSANASWAGDYGVFKGTAGIVTMSEDSEFRGLQFITDGYEITGNANLATSLADAFLRVDGTATAEIAVGIQGPGGVSKTGTGRLILSGVNSYINDTVVQAGTLSVNGEIQNSRTIVNSGATLGGTGLVQETVVNSGGTLAPGNSIGTLKATGDVEFKAGSTFDVEVDPNGADRLNTDGKAVLAGTIIVTPEAGAYQFGKKYTLIDANQGISGKFTTENIKSGFGAGITATLVYSANQLFLQLSTKPVSQLVTAIISGGGFGGGNIAGTAEGLDGAFASGALNRNDFFPLFNLPSGSVNAAVQQFGGEAHATLSGRAIEDYRLVREAVLKQSANQNERGAAAWGQAFGNLGRSRTARRPSAMTR